MYHQLQSNWNFILQPELDIQISVMDSILSESQLENCNLMSVTVESLYSPPESWTMTGQQYMYTSALPLPLAGEVGI